ncbi:MAG: DUF2637 domain-containing protein, partial [Micromonosporaceae bacterium]
PWRAMLFPLAVDGLLVAASVVLLADSRAGRHPDWLAYLLATTGAAVSVAANVAHDWTHPVAATAIAGWPPVALLGSYELLMRLLRRLRPPTPVPVPVSSPAQARKTGTTTGTTGSGTTGSGTGGTRTRTGTGGTRTGTGGTGPGESSDRESGGSRSAGQDKARAHWDAETAGGRTPSGAELSRIGGVDPSLGRRWRRDWLTETDNPRDTAGPAPASAADNTDGRAA